MNQIIRSGNDIGDWETKEITNLNVVYAEAEKQLSLGYKMYDMGLLLETFVIFMRVTKLYEVVNKNLHHVYVLVSGHANHTLIHKLLRTSPPLKAGSNHRVQ